jgi:hypothetical protein
MPVNQLIPANAPIAASRREVKDIATNPNISWMSGPRQKARPSHPDEPKAGSGVEVGQVGTYGDLKRASAPHDGIQIDHNPSKAAVIAEMEKKLGRKLKPHEKSKLINSSPAMAVPDEWHVNDSDTWGPRTREQIAADARRPGAAMSRSMEQYREASGRVDTRMPRSMRSSLR